MAMGALGAAGCMSSGGGADGTGGQPAAGGSVATGGSVSSTGGTSSAGGMTGSAGGTTGSTGGKTGSAGGTTGSAGGGKTGGATGGIGAGGAAATGGSSGTGGSSATVDACGRPTAIAIPSGYTKLAWHDEFDVDGAPSSSNWGYEQGFVRNEELQWYQPNNAQVASGLLVITAKREQKANPNYQAGSSDWKTNRQFASYTSTSMSTGGKQSWQYGRFEMCGKIPISAGMWPAWWTLGVSGEWPSNGEIDIMEFYQGKILANVASGTSTRFQAKWDSATRAVNATFAASFHVWRMDWNATQIDLYVDDTLMNSAKLSDMLNADGTSPFMQKAYMLINLALGGANGGDPTNTAFPQTYQVDYVRVYQ
jgi:beta-glucanase (GH16 family)